MKKQIIVAALAALTSAASAQTVDLVAGFNFGPFFNATGYPTTDGDTPVGSIGNNYRENVSTTVRGLQAVSSEASQFTNATIYFDGSHGSSDWTNDTFPAAAGTVTVSLNSSQTAINNSTVYGTGSRMNTVDTSNARLRFDASATINTFALVVDTTGWTDFNPGDYSFNNDFNFTFAAQAIGSSASITWLFDGLEIGTSTVSTTQSAFNLDLPSEFYGDNDATLTAVVSGTVMLDNMQINGVASAIPEPSAFAALVGLAGLGFAASRRRRA